MEQSLVSSIELTTIYIGNYLGVFLCITMLVGNRVQLQGEQQEKRCLRRLLFCILSCCVLDPLIFTMDGQPGRLAWCVVWFGNTWLFAANVMSGMLWLNIVYLHMNGRVSKLQRRAMILGSGLGAVFLIINYFYPIVFAVDENNVYERKVFFSFYALVMVSCMLNSIIVYLSIRKKGGALKFFPLWVYIIPTSIGIVIQSVVYGVSLVWPCAAVSIAGVLISFQNELIFRDKLTGLYNRYYLDNIYNELLDSGKDTSLAFMMMDINRFKEINDTLGHSTGDHALNGLAGILKSAAGTLGNAIRYAGDEFVVVLNTDDASVVQRCAQDIRLRLERYNETGEVDFPLSVSMGCTIVDVRKESLEDIMYKADALMYEDKKAFYAAHPEFDRRRR